MAVIIGTYNTPIQCHGQLSPWLSCRLILEEMFTTRDQELWGAKTDEEAHIKLPMGIISGK